MASKTASVGVSAKTRVENVTVTANEKEKISPLPSLANLLEIFQRKRWMGKIFKKLGERFRNGIKRTKNCLSNRIDNNAEIITKFGSDAQKILKMIRLRAKQITAAIILTGAGIYILGFILKLVGFTVGGVKYHSIGAFILSAIKNAATGSLSSTLLSFGAVSGGVTLMTFGIILVCVGILSYWGVIRYQGGEGGVNKNSIQSESLLAQFEMEFLWSTEQKPSL